MGGLLARLWRAPLVFSVRGYGGGAPVGSPERSEGGDSPRRNSPWEAFQFGPSGRAEEGPVVTSAEPLQLSGETPVPLLARRRLRLSCAVLSHVTRQPSPSALAAHSTPPRWQPRGAPKLHKSARNKVERVATWLHLGGNRSFRGWQPLVMKANKAK
jgi:hypothetical protein